jgi:hypothetical protein
MIPIQTLKYLIPNKIKDSSALLKSRRFPTSIYIAGYAIEIALKYNICQSLQFRQGFPETKQEFRYYLHSLNQFNAQLPLIHLADIRNHDLNKLLTFSGVESKIKAGYHTEWAILVKWSPENRYRKMRVLENSAKVFHLAAKKILKEIS